MNKKQALALLEKRRYFKESDEEVLTQILEVIDRGNPKRGVARDYEVQRKLVEAFGESYSTLRSYVQMKKSSSKDFRKVCPRTLGWLNDYLDIVEGAESPGIFLASSAISALSFAIGRKYFTKYLLHRTYPATSTVLVGPSGSKKSSAIKFADTLIKPFLDLYTYQSDVANENAKSKVTIVRDKTTPEGLINRLRQPDPSKAQTAYLVFPELATGFGKQSYQSGLIPLLTRLLDQDDYFQENTISRERVEVYNTTVILLGATTEEWLLKEITPAVIAGGTTSRINFVASDATYLIAPGLSTDIEKELQSLGGSIFFALERVESSRVGWTKDATEAFEFEYTEHKVKTQNSDELTSLGSGWASRKFDHLAKLCLLFAISDGRSKIAIKDVENGLFYLDYIEKSGLGLFKKLTSHPMKQLEEKILTTLKSPMSVGEITDIFADQSPSEVRKILGDLVQVGLLQVQGYKFAPISKKKGEK